MADADKGYVIEQIRRLQDGSYSAVFGIGPGERITVQLADVSDFGKTVEDMGARLANLTPK